MDDLTGEVTRSLAGLRDTPVSEHVEVFADAHQRLRAVLDAGGDVGVDDPGSHPLPR